MKNYKELEVWKKVMNLIKEVYILTATFPKEEIYTLTGQTRRASVSIAANIAEGIGRYHRKDSTRFLHISRGSLYELETLLNIAVVTGFLKENTFVSISETINECIKILNG